MKSLHKPLLDFWTLGWFAKDMQNNLQFNFFPKEYQLQGSNSMNWTLFQKRYKKLRTLALIHRVLIYVQIYRKKFIRQAKKSFKWLSYEIFLVSSRGRDFPFSTRYKEIINRLDTIDITVQRYTQIVTGRFARCVYLVFVFTMLIHWKWYNIAENSYFSRNRQNGREYRIPWSQKCPNFSRGIQVQT